ncbi:recombinase family protein [Agathobaculum sp.]|uniref:recombinase family protein n=1 Tax=Agathobaculum sp. TaxID=2048138 RepID=UPI002A7F045A|nr:recombinase family protein [Agathobaculum sp.]MDY3619212.1 recombinase family protein [Agathobaculum sp.]
MTAIYARQSVDKADSISVELQIETCRAQLTLDEATTCEAYTDKGFSGKNTNRPAFQRLMDDVKTGQVQKILVYRLDRISRSVHDFTGLCQILSERGVRFQSCTDGITLDDSLSGTVMAQIMMVFAQFERETIQRRVADNYFGRAKTGMYLGGRPPFGFDKGRTTVDGRRTACYVPSPETAALAAHLFERYAEEGASLGTLCRALNAAGGKTAAGKSWSTLTLGRLLRNPAYVRADAAVYRYLQKKGAEMNDPIERYTQKHGLYCYARRATAAHNAKPTKSKFSEMNRSFITLAPHEGLVDAGLWLEVQHKLDRNRALKNSGAGTHSWLSGLMKCAHCGYAVTVSGNPRGGVHYLNCGGHKRGNAVCPGRQRVTTLEEIEQAVETRLLDYLLRLRGAEMRQKRRQTPEENRLQMEIGRQEAEIARLTQNLGQITEPDVVHILSARLHEAGIVLEKLRRRRDMLRSAVREPDLERCFAAVLSEWRGYSIPEKKQIARAVLARVNVGDGTLELVFRAPPPGKQKKDG